MTPTDIKDPKMVEARKRIIKQILYDYDITREELLGGRRYGGLMEARKDAAHRLRHAGFNICRIGKILRRDHTTICQYFSEQMATRKADRVRLARLLEALPEGARDVIKQNACSQGVHPYDVVRAWLIERAAAESGVKVLEAA
jgi:hypothetical protein